MKPLLVHRDAEAELWEAIDFYESRSPGLGLDLEVELRRSLIAIQNAPRMGPEGRHETRCKMLQRFPYRVHFLETDDTIWIVAIAHCSRRPYYWRPRVG